VKPQEHIALAFVGPVVPDSPRFHGPAFSRAAVMFVTNLLKGMSAAGLRTDCVLSFVPIPSFPRSSRLWCRERPITVADDLRVSFIPFVNLPYVKQFTLSVGAALMLMKWGWSTRHAGQRIVYVFNLTVPSGLFVLAAARLIRALAIVSLNDVNQPGETVPDSFRWRLDYALQRWLIPRFDGYVAVTDRIMQDLAPNRPYVRVEGGVVPEEHGATARSPRSTTTAQPFTLVAAGSLDEANGFDVLVAAMRRLDDQNVRLRIAGDGPLVDLVRRAAAEDKRIEYCGYLSFQEVVALYKTADLLLNLRITKAIKTRYFFPSKLMEYFASGVPVMTTYAGHVHEEYADAAVFLDDETPEGLTARLKDVLSMDSGTLRSLGDRARTRTLSAKAWNVQGRKVAEYLHRIADGRRSSAVTAESH